MLELVNATKIYQTKAGQVPALDNLSLILPSKGMVFVTGKSGSGKTTLLNVIGGLDGMDHGEIIIDGKRFSEFTQKEFDSYRNTFIGFIFQEYNLLPDYTIEKNIKIADELQGRKTDEEKFDEILKKVGIFELKKRKPSELSGGQKQRVAIARALVKNPKIIMADEPTGALDSITGKQVIELMKELSKEKLVLVVSHDLEMAEKYADRIIRLVDGRVVEDISLTDSLITSNIYENETDLCVKSGAELSNDETLKLVKAIREKKEIKVLKEISVRERKATKVEKEDVSNKNVNLVKSKMKYSSAAYLGLKSLGVKPFRLIITILLSVVAFAVFGLFDTIAAYEDSRIVANLLRNAGYSGVAVNPVYTYGEDELYYKFNQESIDKLNKNTNYNFRGVYDISTESYMNTNKYVSIDFPSAMPRNDWYYAKRLNGIIEFGSNEIKTTYDSNGDIKSQTVGGGFNYKVIHGSYPTIEYDNEGKLINNVAISSYMAESILFHSSNKYDGKVLNTIEDLVGLKLNMDKKVYVIKGIVNCGKIPSKYSILKTTTMNQETEVLRKDLDTYVNSGCYLYLFAPKGYVDLIRQANKNSDKYYTNSYESYKVNIPGDYSKPLTIQNNLSVFYNFEDYGHQQMGFDSYEYAKNNLIDFNNILVNKNENPNITKPTKENDNTYGVYVSVRNITEIYYYEMREIEGLYPTEINGIESVFYSPYSTIDEVRESVNSLKDLFDKYNSEKGDFFTAKLDKDISITMENGYRNKVVKFKIDGFYYDINPSSTETSTILPLVITKNAMKELGVYTGQGHYSKAITPLKSNYFGAKTLAGEISSTSKNKLEWYSNQILDVIQKNGVIVKKVSTLVLYIAIVLAIFSIFMLFNYISTSIVSKRQSIGVLRALGSGGKDIFKMFITESLIISIINGVLSILLTYFACGFVNSYIRNVMFITLDLAVFDLRQVILLFAISLTTGIISSLIPILRISKEKPVKLIREP